MGTHPIFESDFDCLTDKNMELGYWNYRALIGPCKLLLEYVGADWNDVQYERIKKSDGTLDPAQWTEVKNSEKFQKNFAFPNMPYLIDGNVHLTQSLAILKYISRKYGLGQNLSELETIRADLGCDQIVEVRDLFINFCYGEELFVTPF